MKKLLVCLIVLVMLLQTMPAVFATSSRVVFTDFRYTDSEGYGISEPENGLVNTEVTAAYNGSDEQNVMLVVMLCDKETGKIKLTDYDSAVLSAAEPAANLKAGVTVADIEAEEYKYFLWDGVTEHTPLDNSEPAAAENFVDEVNKPNMIGLKWDAAYDDFDDLESYNLYNGDVLISTGSDETVFEDKNLDKNSLQNYTIEAIDGEGLISAKKELSVVTADVPNIEMSTDDTESTTGVTENGVYLWLPVAREVTGPKAGDKTGYGYTEATEAGGRACRVAPDYLRGSSTLIGRFTAKVDPAVIDAEDSNVIVDITYFDEDTETVNISYTRNDSTSTTLKTGSSSFNKTGTGLWKTASFRFTDAAFHYYMDDGTGRGNFRFWQATPGLKVSNIAVSRRADYDGDAAGLRVKDVPEIRDVIFYMDKAEVTEADGANCIGIDSGESFDFDVTDTRLNGVKDVNIEIEYFDEGTGEIFFDYQSTSGVSEKSITLTNSGKWKNARISVNDAKFTIGKNLPVSTDDLIVSTSGEPLKIKSIRMYDAR